MVSFNKLYVLIHFDHVINVSANIQTPTLLNRLVVNTPRLQLRGSRYLSNNFEEKGTLPNHRNLTDELFIVFEDGVESHHTSIPDDDDVNLRVLQSRNENTRNSRIPPLIVSEKKDLNTTRQGDPFNISWIMLGSACLFLGICLSAWFIGEYKEARLKKRMRKAQIKERARLEQLLVTMKGMVSNLAFEMEEFEKIRSEKQERVDRVEAKNIGLITSYNESLRIEGELWESLIELRQRMQLIAQDTVPKGTLLSIHQPFIESEQVRVFIKAKDKCEWHHVQLIIGKRKVIQTAKHIFEDTKWLRLLEEKEEREDEMGDLETAIEYWMKRLKNWDERGADSKDHSSRDKMIPELVRHACCADTHRKKNQIVRLAERKAKIEIEVEVRKREKKTEEKSSIESSTFHKLIEYDPELVDDQILFECLAAEDSMMGGPDGTVNFNKKIMTMQSTEVDEKWNLNTLKEQQENYKSTLCTQTREEKLQWYERKLWENYEKARIEYFKAQEDELALQQHKEKFQTELRDRIVKVIRLKQLGHVNYPGIQNVGIRRTTMGLARTSILRSSTTPR